MPVFEFTVVLDRAPVDDDVDRLFEAGLDDSVPETRAGRGVLSVARESETLAEALAGVLSDIARAGFRAVSIEDDDLVSLKTVARRIGRSYESVRLLASGKRGVGGFPPQLSGDGWALYSWSLVAEWCSRAGIADVAVVSEERRLLVAASLMLRAAETAGASIGDLLPLVAQIAAAEPLATQART